MGDPGRIQDDKFEPQPEQLNCIRSGGTKALKYLREVVYWEQSVYCRECENKPKCKEKEEK